METVSDIKKNTDHPSYYGGKDNPYEAIKVLHEWHLDEDAYLWNVGKYLSRAGHKDGNSQLQDLTKARWYLDYKIQLLTEQQKITEEVVDTLKKMPNEITDELTKMPVPPIGEESIRWINGRGYCICKDGVWENLTKENAPYSIFTGPDAPNIETAVIPECADEVKF